MREESKQDECIKTRTLFKGSASKTCVSRTPTQDEKGKKTAMNLSLVSECMNNYKYYINFLSYFLDLSAKQLKQHVREDCAPVELGNHRKEHQRQNA